MQCSGCHITKYFKEFTKPEWNKPEQDTALYKVCKALEKKSKEESWKEWKPHCCSKCQKGFASEQGRNTHEEGYDMTGKEKEESWKEWEMHCCSK